MRYRTPLIVAIATLIAADSVAETLVATRTIRSKSVVQAEDIGQLADVVPGTLTDPLDAVGMEARITIFAGRPIREGDLAAPALVERNAVVSIIYRTGGLTIVSEGRAMGRAGAGEIVKVMNLSSRITVAGQVAADGTVHVGPLHGGS